MKKITQERMQEVRNAFRVLGSLTDEELKFFTRVIYLTKGDSYKTIQPKERTYEDVTEIIHKLGIKPNIKGYDYLRSAIIYYMKAEKKDKVSLTKELYPAVAAEYNSTISRVERAIRHAIQTVYRNGNLDILCEISGSSEMLTNGEAIACIAEYLNNSH